MTAESLYDRPNLFRHDFVDNCSFGVGFKMENQEGTFSSYFAALLPKRRNLLNFTTDEDIKSFLKLFSVKEFFLNAES